MRFAAVVALALVFALAGPATAGAGTSGPSTHAAGTADATIPRHPADAQWNAPVRGVGDASEVDGEYDQLIDVHLRQNGDARWTVTLYEDLASEADVEAFRTLGERWEAGIADVDFDAELFRQFASLASDATGRQMAIPEDSVRRNATVRNETGVLELSFTWTGFARTEGHSLVVDDAFQSPSGTWLPELEAGQALVIRPPPGYEITDSPPGPGVDNQTIRWEGPRTFSEDYFVEEPIVYRADPTRTSPTPTPTPPPTSPPTPGSNLPSGLLFGVLAALLAGGAMAVYRSAGDVDLEGSASGGAAETEDGGEPEPPSDPEPDDPFAGVDEELLSDDERVLRLLDANGGRMKQADIVTETGWSNAKVSQLLSSMAEEGEVDKLRIGRENLISLPDVDVEDVEE